MLSALKVMLVIGALLGAELLYNSWQEEQGLIDRCVQTMVFEAAKFDGYWVETNGLDTQSIDGRFRVLASASKPLQWEDQDTRLDRLEADSANGSLYMIRCTVYESKILTSLVVEKLTPENNWTFVNPNYVEESDDAIEFFERKEKEMHADESLGTEN